MKLTTHHQGINVSCSYDNVNFDILYIHSNLTDISLKQNKSVICPFILKELYSEPYEKINWASQRNNVSWADLYSPHSWALDTAYCKRISLF